MSQYDDKTIAEIVHDYAVTRGDLVEQYARDQIVDVIEQRIARERAAAWDSAVQAVAWCLDNGEPSAAAALAYVAENNPHRAHPEPKEAP